MVKRKDYFDAFCRVSGALGKTTNHNTLLKLIVKSAVESLDGKAACLFLKDPGANSFIAKAQTGLSENYLHASPIKAAELVRGLKKKGYLVFEDAATDVRLENRQAKIDEGIGSILTVPVQIAGATKGVLSLYTANKRKFTQRQIQFLKALADQGGNAIHTNGLLTRLRKNAMLFLELASCVNSSLDFKEILENLTVNTCQTLEMKGADIRLIDEDTGAMRLVASHGLSQQFLEIKKTINTETTTRALNGETIILSRADTDERVRLKKEMIQEGIKSMIVTPILAREHVIGVMRLYNADYAQFPPDVLVMIEALAHHGGLAIQNASMYIRLKEDKKSLEKDIWSHRAWF